MIGEWKRTREIIYWWSERKAFLSIIVMFAGFFVAQLIGNLIFGIPLMILMGQKVVLHPSFMIVDIIAPILFFPIGIRTSDWALKKAIPWYLK